jgi:hypothetical protein
LIILLRVAVLHPHVLEALNARLELASSLPSSPEKFMAANEIFYSSVEVQQQPFHVSA